MRFDENAIAELRKINNKLAELSWRYSDVKSEENELLRHISSLIDGAILTSRREKNNRITINSKDLLKLKENANARGVSIEEAIEDLIYKYNKGGEKDGSFWSCK